jgi:lipopolysaccharide transport system ATP-binding protein
MEVIKLQNVSKTYTYYTQGIDRLLEVITRQPRHQSFIALHPLDLTISHGQVVGIVGNNGAGKSTLLKMIAGTLRADTGHCEVKGRISALLELGGGFHPEMSGRENVYLNGTMMGLSLTEIDTIYQEIVDFAGIGDFIEQPVKTYSSGMFTRLAFAVATCVEPDILIVDETLSVGDGAFARKSFNRFMQFKKSGKTILFCSHALYQVESICDRVIWLDKGQVKLDGMPSQVVTTYNDFMTAMTVDMAASPVPTASLHAPVTAIPQGSARLTEIAVSVDGMMGKKLDAISRHSELCITVGFSSDPELPAPTLGLVILGAGGQIITSAGTRHDGLPIQRNATGDAKVRVHFPQLSLLKGEYWIDLYLLCENALHVYDQANAIATLKVQQIGLELGVVSLPRHWVQI